MCTSCLIPNKDSNLTLSKKTMKENINTFVISHLTLLISKLEREREIQVGSPDVRLRLAHCTSWVKQWSETMDFLQTFFKTNILFIILCKNMSLYQDFQLTQ